MRPARALVSALLSFSRCRRRPAPRRRMRAGRARPRRSTRSTRASTRPPTSVLPKVVTWRRDLHAHPELGNQEVRTSAFLAEQLRAMGYEVRTGVAKTGVVAVLKGGKPGPVVALRADMDALPVTEETGLPFASKARGEYNGREVGVMHACGHDFHMSMLLGAAEVLAGMKADLAGHREDRLPAGRGGRARRARRRGGDGQGRRPRQPEGGRHVRPPRRHHAPRGRLDHLQAEGPHGRRRHVQHRRQGPADARRHALGRRRSRSSWRRRSCSACRRWSAARST